MSVLIKDMEMPSICDCCDFCDTDYTNYRKCCRRLFEDIPWEFGQNGTLPDCPLVEVEPHGRLIDATFEETHYASMLLDPTPDVTEQDKKNATIIIEALRMARTVIEAEGSE